jgi:hypothetical protein
MAGISRKERNFRHAKNPQPGDYWHEKFIPVLVVLNVDRENKLVTYCRKTILGEDYWHGDWHWELNDTETVRVDRFARYLAYGGKPEDGFWADVIIRHFEPLARQWKRLQRKENE